MGNNQSIAAHNYRLKRKLQVQDIRSVKPALSISCNNILNSNITVQCRVDPTVVEVIEEGFPERGCPKDSLRKTKFEDSNSDISTDNNIRPFVRLLRSNAKCKDRNSNNSSEASLQPAVKSLGSNTKEFQLGSVVLAKLRDCDPYWPAIVVHGADVGKYPSKTHCTWVFWLGSRNISEVRKTMVVRFDLLQVIQKKGKMFNQGLSEAQRELDFQNSNETEEPLNTIDNITEYLPLTPTMWAQIREFKSENATRSSVLVRERLSVRLPPNSPTHKARRGQLDMKDFCISCDDGSRPVAGEHPLFIGGTCEECLASIKETIFDCGIDGAGSYCIICTNPGDLIVCEHPNCMLKTFCTHCLNRLVSQKATEEALSADFWHCFLCSDEERDESCLIKIRSDWRSRLMLLFGAQRECAILEIDPTVQKRSITVLSLFDGISTGRIALDKLGLCINKYYASEIDSDSMLVSDQHLRDKVIQLGSVQSLTEERLASLDPIDLVIGGSPCNDLSLVNPDRKGLYNITGTGILFFDYFRILKIVQELNKNRHVFWMFENVASMPMEYRSVINRFFQSEPSILDARYFSAQRRPRFFWGNLPGMHSPLPESLEDSTHELQSILDPGRTAVVDKLQTITTNSNSLMQGKTNLFPIEEKGQGVVPTISELERVFGFPSDYTNTGNFSRTQRLKLLGKSWSVPVIVHILRPLKTFFSLEHTKEVPIQS